MWEVNPATGQIGNKVAELKGHTEIINRAAFSPDGRYAITASSDGTARIWDLNQGGKQVALLKHELKVQNYMPDKQNAPPSVWVKSAVFNPKDVRYILTASWDGTARLWYWNRLSATVEQKPTSFISQDGGINNAVFSKDGAYIVTAGNDGKAKVLEWDRATGKFGRFLFELPHEAPVLDAAFNPADDAAFNPQHKRPPNIVTACADKEAQLWKFNTDSSDSPTTDVRLQAHSDWVTTVAFSQDGQSILTTSYDGTALVWRDPNKQEKLERYLDQPSLAPVLSVAFDNGGKRFLTGSSNGLVRLWEITLKKLSPELDISGAVLDVVFSKDGKQANVAASDASMTLMNLVDKRAIDINALTGRELSGQSILKEEILSVALDPDASRLASGGRNGMVSVWNFFSKGDQQIMENSQESSAPVNSIAFRPQRNQIVTASNDGVTRLWDIAKSSVIQRWRQSAPVRCAVFSLDGNSIATVGDDGIILIRSVEDSRLLQQMTGYEGSTPLPIFRAKFSHNGKWLATTDFDTVRVWDVNTGKQLAKIIETSTDPRFSKGSQNNPTPTFTSTKGQRLINNLAFSPDDRYIITARSDNKAVHIFAWIYFPLTAEELLKKAEIYLGRYSPLE